MAEKVKKAPEAIEPQEVRVERPKRAVLTAEESMERMDAFSERRDQIVAAVRKSKSRSLRP
jgi:hypothetical protein